MKKQNVAILFAINFVLVCGCGGLSDSGKHKNHGFGEDFYSNKKVKTYDEPISADFEFNIVPDDRIREVTVRISSIGFECNSFNPIGLMMTPHGLGGGDFSSYVLYEYNEELGEFYHDNIEARMSGEMLQIFNEYSPMSECKVEYGMDGLDVFAEHTFYNKANGKDRKFYSSIRIAYDLEGHSGGDSYRQYESPYIGQCAKKKEKEENGGRGGNGDDPTPVTPCDTEPAKYQYQINFSLTEILNLIEREVFQRKDITDIGFADRPSTVETYGFSYSTTREDRFSHFEIRRMETKFQSNIQYRNTLEEDWDVLSE